MSQRFCLFYAGYTSYAPTFYYDQLALFEQVQSPADETLKTRIEQLMASLNEPELEGASHIQTSMSIARELEVEVPEFDRATGLFSDWRGAFTQAFESAFPMTRIEHYYFFFGHRLSQLVCDASLAARYTGLLSGIEKEPNLLKRSDKAIKDIQFVLYKMMAPAALLSGEARHHYFGLFYKEISKAFEPYGTRDVKSIGDEELTRLSAGLSDYSLLVTNGFKKCVGLLKELGV